MTKELIKESDNESDNESIKGSNNKSIKEADNESIEKTNKESEEESIKDLKEPSSLNNKSTTDWYDKNKFDEILATIDNNKFNHKNKIGGFKFNDINDLINNIKNNTISEADTKKKINKLNKIKNVEIKGKRLIKNQEKLLSLFDDLKTIFNNNNNSNNKNENENDDEQCYDIKQLNDWFKTADQTKSLEEQTEILKTKDFLDEYWNVGYYHGDKELNCKILKAKAAHLLNDLDKQLLKKIFGYTFAALVDKPINTTSKE